eukprot:4690208-Pleurochrysis_carterae.AAC.6
MSNKLLSMPVVTFTSAPKQPFVSMSVRGLIFLLGLPTKFVKWCLSHSDLTAGDATRSLMKLLLEKSGRARSPSASTK